MRYGKLTSKECEPMSKYEFSLKQEVLMEKGAAVLGDLFRYRSANNIDDSKNPVAIMYALVWNAKRDVLSAQTEEELIAIDGKFDLAGRFLTQLEGASV